MEPIAEWCEMLQAHGFVVDEVLTSPLAGLEPQRLIADDGFVRGVKFARNVLRDKQTRRRVFAMARTLRRHEKFLEAVGLLATRPANDRV